MTATVRSPGAGDLYPTRVPGSAAPFRRRRPGRLAQGRRGPFELRATRRL